MNTEEKLKLVDKCQTQVWELNNKQNKLFDDLITTIGETDDEIIDFIWDNVFNQSEWTRDVIKDMLNGKKPNRHTKLIPDGIE